MKALLTFTGIFIGFGAGFFLRDLENNYIHWLELNDLWVIIIYFVALLILTAIAFYYIGLGRGSVRDMNGEPIITIIRRQ